MHATTARRPEATTAPRDGRATTLSRAHPPVGPATGVDAGLPRRRGRSAWSTPTGIRVRAAVIVLTVVALGAILVVGIGSLRGGLRVIGQQNAPAVAAASDLYFVLNDMDAQVANVLLVGEDQKLGFTRQQALDIYETRRRQAAADTQRAVTAVGSDPTGQQAVRNIVDYLGRYEALAAEAVLLDGQTPHPAGHPPAAALDRYRQATDLLKADLLPAAGTLTDRNAQTLQASYTSRRDTAAILRVLLMAFGVALLAALIALQIHLSRKFQRSINPALVAATLVAAVLAASSVLLFTNEIEHLRTAKKDAFDSILALTRARAVSYDANADESRYLVDPARAEQYQADFLAKSQQLAQLDGASIASYDAALEAYQKHHTDVRLGGYFGTELRNITFTGERAAAEETLARYQIYQRDDRRIRSLATGGDLRAAIAFCTSYQPGDSNYAFGQYDEALTAVTAINQKAFDEAISAGNTDLDGWYLKLAAAAAAIAVLTFLGVRRRLAEYR